MTAEKLVTNLVSQVQRLANRVDSNYRTRVLESINAAVRQLASEAPWDGLRRVERFLAPGGQYMTFPARVRKVITIADVTSTLPVDPGGDFARRFGASYIQQSSTLPIEWRPAGTMPVIAAPATDTQLRLQTGVSEGIQVTIRGLVRDTGASGTALELYEVSESLVMGGSGVTDTAATFVQIKEISTEQNRSSDLTVKSTVTGAILARIPPWQAYSEYARVEFFGSPEQGRQLHVEYFTDPERVLSEGDTLHSAVDIDYVKWRAVGDLHWMKQEQEAARLAWAEADAVLARLKNRENSFGERDSSNRPLVNYFDLESTDF